MNYMKKIAEMLGVELGEKFYVQGCETCPDTDYAFIEEGLVYFLDGKKYLDESVLEALLIGEATIIKKPWKPKKGEKYYSISTNGGICVTVNDGFTADAALIAFGNCFCTREEAEAHKNEILAKMREVLGE